MAEKGTVVFKKEMTGNLQRQQTGKGFQSQKKKITNENQKRIQ